MSNSEKIADSEKSTLNIDHCAIKSSLKEPSLILDSEDSPNLIKKKEKPDSIESSIISEDSILKLSDGRTMSDSKESCHISDLEVSTTKVDAGSTILESDESKSKEIECCEKSVSKEPLELRSEDSVDCDLINKENLINKEEDEVKLDIELIPAENNEQTDFKIPNIEDCIVLSCSAVTKVKSAVKKVFGAVLEDASLLSDRKDKKCTKSKNCLKKEARRLVWKARKKKKKEALARGDDMEAFREAELAELPFRREKRKAEEDFIDNQEIKKAKLETKALKAKRPGFSEERYNETSYYIENGLRKVYPYYFTFTTFTKGRWVGERIIDVFAKEFRAHPAEEYERCIQSGTLTVNYEKVDIECRLKHNDLLANIVHRHEVPVSAAKIPIVHVDQDMVVVNKPASIPVHPCGRYRHNTVVFILAKEYNLKNLRTIHRLDRLTSGLLLFGRTPKKAREMEQQIRTRQVKKEYVCRIDGEFPTNTIICTEPIEVVSYKIGVCKVAAGGKDCRTEFQRLSYNGSTSVVLCRPKTGRMHQIRVHLQYLGYPIVNDPLYNHSVFGPEKGKGGIRSKTDEQLIQDLIQIHNAENWLGMDGDSEYSMFKPRPKEGDCSPLKGDSTYPRIVSPPSFTEVSQNLYNTTSNSYTAHSPASTPCPQFLENNPMSSASPELVMLPGDSSPTDGRDYGFRPPLMTFDPHCYECKVKYRDPKPKDLVMYLHALKYGGPGWEFETPLPDWALEDWKEDS